MPQNMLCHVIARRSLADAAIHEWLGVAEM